MNLDVVTGYAKLYNTPSKPRPARNFPAVRTSRIYLPNSLYWGDVLGGVDHETEVASTEAGTLTLRDDGKGVRYWMRLPDDWRGPLYAALIHGGHFRGSSTRTRTEDVQRIHRVGHQGLVAEIALALLVECGPVRYPAIDTGAPVLTREWP